MSTTIVGGIGTIVGPIIGAGFTVWLGEALSGYPEIHVAITGVIVILHHPLRARGHLGHRRQAVQAHRGRRGDPRPGAAAEPARTEEHTHAAEPGRGRARSWRRPARPARCC